MAVIKILPRHSPSYGNLINYILKEGKNEKPQIITHNLHSNNPTLATKEFLQNESFRTNIRSDQVYLYHEIISFNNLDSEKIKPEMLEDLARTYIQMRGNEGVYLGAVHQDKVHIHIHFCTSGIKLYTGQAMRLARDDLRQLKVSFQQYHQRKFPEIEKSNCEHGKSKQYIKNNQWQIQNRNNMKTQIRDTVQECLEKANTQKEFLELLRENNLNHYERKAGEITGIVMDDNNKFRFSRLDIDMDKLKALPLDMTEEQKALKEIEEIREQRQDKTLHRILEFEENGIPKTISYNMEMKTESWRDANGKFHDIESELTTDEYLRFENINSIMNEYPDRFDKDEPDRDSSDLDEFVEYLNSTDDIEIDDEPDLDSDDDRDIDDDEPDRDDDNDLDMDSDDDFDR